MARGNNIWFNGKIVAEKDARISLFSHGLHYGTGAFEGIRCYRQANGGGGIFRLQDHIERLEESAKILGFKLPFTRDQLIQACVDACKANHFEECYVRPIFYIGDGPLGVGLPLEFPVDVAILVWEWGKYLGDQGAEKGVRLKISSFVRPHVNSLMTKGKITGQYVNSVLAKREANLAGYDEALLLDPEGYLTEGTGENLFLVKNGKVKTTPLTSVLCGITRNTVMKYFEHKGNPVQEIRFSRDELWCADEVFLTGTAAEITPVAEIDGRPIGKGAGAGKPGPMSKQLALDYAEIVKGKVPSYGQDWITKFKSS